MVNRLDRCKQARLIPSLSEARKLLREVNGGRSPPPRSRESSNSKACNKPVLKKPPTGDCSLITESENRKYANATTFHRWHMVVLLPLVEIDWAWDSVLVSEHEQKLVSRSTCASRACTGTQRMRPEAGVVRQFASAQEVTSIRYCPHWRGHCEISSGTRQRGIAPCRYRSIRINSSSRPSSSMEQCVNIVPKISSLTHKGRRKFPASSMPSHRSSITLWPF